MLSSSQVIVQKYRIDTPPPGVTDPLKGLITITEYFIESSQICFNEFSIFKSEKPRNLTGSKYTHKLFDPFTYTPISKELINQIENSLDQSNSDAVIDDLLKNNDMYKILFHKPKNNAVLTDKEDKLIKDSFSQRCKIKGNYIIKKAIVQYIFYGVIANDTNLKEITELANKLSPIEKESLVNSINLTLSTDAGKLSEKRSQATKDIETESPDLITSTILGGVTGAAFSVVSQFNVGVSTGFGLFSAFALKYASNEYEKYKINQLWSQREERLKTVFDMLNVNPENNTNTTRMTL